MSAVCIVDIALVYASEQSNKDSGINNMKRSEGKTTTNTKTLKTTKKTFVIIFSRIFLLFFSLLSHPPSVLTLASLYIGTLCHFLFLLPSADCTCVSIIVIQFPFV